MKTVLDRRAWLIAGALLLATSGFAQKEQWLRYTTSSEGRSYEYLELTTNAPPGLKLPELNAAPLFARWLTPLDASGGRWLCLDRSRKNGPYDRLYLDLKGDGSLGKAPLAATRTDQNSAYFTSLKMIFKGEDGPITYHLQLRFMKYENDEPRLLASSGCYYQGEVNLDGKKRHLELVDGNVNGAFNDCGASPGESDSVSIRESKEGERYLGKLLEVDGVFYNIEVARDGAFVKLQKAENVTLGKVQVPVSIGNFSAFGPIGHFTRKPEKGELTLPVGAYAVQDWRIQRKDSNGAGWEMTGYRGKEPSKFEVATAGAAKPTLAEPVRMELKAVEATNRVAFSLSFTGNGGESIYFTKGTQRPPGPKLLLASLDGSYRATNTFEFG